MKGIFTYFGRNIYYLRQEKGVTQKEMADILGVGVTTLRKIEKEDTSVRINGSMVCRVCNAYELSADVILREDMTKKKGRP